MKTGNKTPVRILLFAVIAILITAGAAGVLLYFGVIHLNHPGISGYTVKGVDVSSYQGDIDWNMLSSQGIDFAFIKATEGSSTVDRCFEYNWESASKTPLRIGAYHFFSFESSGEDQARLFCSTVGKVPDMLPPVIDVEYYGRFRSVDDIDPDAVKNELRSMIDDLEAYYGVKPVIYVSENTYIDLVKDSFSDCGIWYRSVYKNIPEDIRWTFWQYSNRHVLKGYNGSERYIDMNVFAGDKNAFMNGWKQSTR